MSELTQEAKAQYEKLVQEVRMRQHDLGNQLSAVRNISSEEARRYLEELNKDQRHNVLLLCGDPLLAGLLYQKCTEAEEKGITVESHVSARLGDCALPRHEMIAIVGGLLDNAIDAEMTLDREERHICINVDTEDEKYRITVANRYPYVPYETIHGWFQAGASSKGLGRGLGLAHAKKICASGNADIAYGNQETDGKNEIFFMLYLEKAPVNENPSFVEKVPVNEYPSLIGKAPVNKNAINAENDPNARNDRMTSTTKSEIDRESLKNKRENSSVKKTYQKRRGITYALVSICCIGAVLGLLKAIRIMTSNADSSQNSIMVENGAVDHDHDTTPETAIASPYATPETAVTAESPSEAEYGDAPMQGETSYATLKEEWLKAQDPNTIMEDAKASGITFLPYVIVPFADLKVVFTIGLIGTGMLIAALLIIVSAIRKRIREKAEPK